MKTKFHLLFEQSGTFRDVMRNNGHDALCYDIQNEYGKTDVVIDLFAEIDREYDNLIHNAKPEFTPAHTMFTDMNPDKDFIISFFPCTYFTNLNELRFKLWTGGKQYPMTPDRVQATIRRTHDRARTFELWTKFCFIVQELGIPTIIENPRGVGDGRNYLMLYSHWQPSWTDTNRRNFGDKFVKPTLYFAINFDMVEEFQMFTQHTDYKVIGSQHKRTRTPNVPKARGTKERSEITHEYAQKFYERFLKGKVK